ncbi:MAG: DUF4157 domain-containing protein [Rhodocyclaceae bacterium]|nr:DUF4157 domain-containing protein [Rhodocyclaceae bacterium]
MGRSGDEAEHHADRVAARALAAPARPGPASVTPLTPGHAVRQALAQVPQNRATGDEGPVPEALEDRILALSEGGTPLPAHARADMEARFGLDFGAVRIHTGGEAARLAGAVDAHAFTLGEHIVFDHGRFAPEAPGGRFLLAHELAHVAQQRATGDTAQPLRRGFWSDLYDAAAERLGDIAEWGIAQVREFGWELVRSISPELARTLEAIIDEGVVHWLGRQVARAWDTYIATLKALVPFEGPRQLIDLFAGLVERAATIVAALASGDCEPLMTAIGDMKRFVVETVGVAWDRLSEFLRPIGEFFGELWANFGAPAVQWLKDFGGEVWQGIQDLGARLWAWVRPVKEAAERVWNWFAESLFGPSETESGGSQGGVVGWISAKAGEAFDWVREQTRPVWQPVAQFAGQVAELIPPAFVRDFGERAQQLSADLNAAGKGMDGGEGVPEQRDTLAGMLPSVQGVIASVRSILVFAGEWLSTRVGALATAVTALIGRLQVNTLLSWLATAFAWLSEAVDTLAEWAREKVGALFALMLSAFDALTPFFELVLGAVRKVITVYGDLMQLPALVLNAIWQQVPACIREPIEAFVEQQILARIPVFGQFFSDPTWWPKLKQTALALLRRLFVDGDILGVAWDFFKAALRLMGLPPELVVQILAKAAQAIGDVLTNPIGFLINLLKAMGAGFMRFFGNIGKHLLSGVTGWLFGAVREAGIEPPADFSLGSVFRFVLDVLGLTVDNVLTRLKKKLDPAIVEKLTRMLEVATGVWSFVSILMTEGVAGLWRVISEKIGNLWTTVVEGIMSFVTTRVIAWASLWLASLLDWTGITATITTLLAIWRAIQAAIEYLKQMLEIVARFLDGVIAIAAGTIDTAANYLEDALVRSLPVAIGFLAYQAGIGRLSAKLREILGAIRERIEGAIDAVIDYALKLGKATIDLVKRGATAVKSGVRRLREWWRAKAGFRAADGESHEVFIEGQGRGATLMVASRTPTSYERFLERERANARTAGDTQREQDIDIAIPIAADLGEAMAAATQEDAVKGGVRPVAAPDQTVDHGAVIGGLLAQLAIATARFMPTSQPLEPSTPPEYGPLYDNTFGRRVEVAKLNRLHQRGSTPGSRADPSGHWNTLRKRYKPGGSRTFYVRGHLLNDNLGGPGDDWRNLTPITQDANNSDSDSMLRLFEKPVKDAIDAGVTVHLIVTANYGRSAQAAPRLDAMRQAGQSAQADIADLERHTPLSIDCEVTAIDGKTDVAGNPKPEAEALPKATVKVTNNIDNGAPEGYSVTPANRGQYNARDEYDSLLGEAQKRLDGNATYDWQKFAKLGLFENRLAELEAADPQLREDLETTFESDQIKRLVAVERKRISEYAMSDGRLRDWLSFRGMSADAYKKFAGPHQAEEAALQSAYEAVFQKMRGDVLKEVARISGPENWGDVRRNNKLTLLREGDELLDELKGAFDARMATVLTPLAREYGKAAGVWSKFDHYTTWLRLPEPQREQVRQAHEQALQQQPAPSTPDPSQDGDTP